MKIYNEDKTHILENVDLESGYLQRDRLIISEEQQEKFHYEEKHYANGGVAKYKVIDNPYKPAEYEDIQVYIPYTKQELNQNKILSLKQRLFNTDYQAIKYAEGELTEEEYAPIKAQRKEWREEINRLEEELNNGNNR